MKFMEKKEKKHTPDNFFDWVRHEKFAIGLALFCAFCPLLENLGWDWIWAKEEMVPHSFSWCVQQIFKGHHQYQFVNILFIFIVLLMLTRMKILQGKNDEKIEKLHEYVKDTFGENSTLASNTPEELFNRISIGVKQFYYLWVSVWAVWLVMYIVKFIHAIYIIQCKEGLDCVDCQTTLYVSNLLENSLNLISSFLLFFIYMDITVSTVSVGTLTGNGRSNMHVGTFMLILIGTIFFTVDLFSRFLPAESYHYTQLYLRLFIGLIASMSMMAVLGRLNTSFLKIPQSLIICLYLYATVQMLYPFTYGAGKICEVKKLWISSDMLNDVLSISAFLGKGCLILVLQWITKENRFLFFLIHKANSLSDSDAMLRRFNKYYKGCPDK